MTSETKRPSERNERNKPRSSMIHRKSQFEPLDARRLLAALEPIQVLEQGPAEFSTVLLTSTFDVSTTSLVANSATQLPPSAELDEVSEGFGWSEGSGYVPGSVLSSADQIDWSTNTEDNNTWGDGFGTSQSSGSGGGSSGSGSGGSSGSGSGGSSGSGSGGSSGSGSGGSSGSGSGGSSGSGSGGSSGSGSGGPSGSGSGGSSGSGSGGSSGSGSGQNTAPVIQNFACSYNQGYYTFTGYVTDNTNPAGLTIYFGGLLSGSDTTILGNGSFTFSTALTAPSGQVTSITRDTEGLWSNVMNVEM